MRALNSGRISSSCFAHIPHLVCPTNPSTTTKRPFPKITRNGSSSHAAEKISANTTDNFSAHHWQLSKSHLDIEAFRTNHKLILVDSSRTDAALTQYLLVAPRISCMYSSHTTHPSYSHSSFSASTSINCQLGHYETHSSPTGYTNTIGFSLTPWSLLQAILSPFLFTMWTIPFGMAQHQVETAGWLSVMDWALWFYFTHLVPGPFALPMLLFQ